MKEAKEVSIYEVCFKDNNDLTHVAADTIEEYNGFLLFKNDHKVVASFNKDVVKGFYVSRQFEQIKENVIEIWNGIKECVSDNITRIEMAENYIDKLYDELHEIEEESEAYDQIDAIFKAKRNLARIKDIDTDDWDKVDGS